MNRGIFGLIWAAAVSVFLFSTACNDTGTDGGPSAATCATSADCGGAEFCSNGKCAEKLTVGACADTSEHKATDVCRTAICLGGGCCNSVCSASDPLCKAASCDVASGACQFPAATVACGPSESCANGSHTAASTCNGKGGCALAQPKACDSLACNNDGKTCLPGCHDNSTCPTGEYCAWGQCAPQLQPGATCGQTSTSPAGSACSGSGLCLGTFCCATACDTTDVQCGANSCDSSGACIYPDQKTTCGALQACTGEQYTPPSACNGSGTCSVATPRSCEPYICNEPGAVCFATCTSTGGQCALDSYCGATKCALKEPPGQACAATSTSNANQACISGICSGNCCSVDCPPDPLTYNCKGLCDTAGACVPKTCPNNFGCSGTVDCNTQCATNADCYALAFCDPAGATACCNRFNPGDTIYIDGSAGDDTNPCCGASATPCQTISHAMTLIANSATTGVNLMVSNTSGSNTWTKQETYPIHLGWGVTLTAPAIYFVNQTKASDIFDVYAYDPSDTGTVTITGGGTDLTSDGIYIGFDPVLYFTNYNQQVAFFNAKVSINDAVAGKTALPLVISDVWSNANDNSGGSYDLKVGAGAKVTIGPGPVEMGNGFNVPGAGTGNNFYYNLRGYHGIYCKGAGASINDDPTSSSWALSVENKSTDFLDIQDGCTVNLTQGPLLGGYYTYPNGWDGTATGCANTGYYDCFNECYSTAQNGAIVATGSANISFGSSAMPGRIGCAVYGISEQTSNASGSPTVAINGAVVDMSTETVCYYYGSCYNYGGSCAGAMVREGTFSASSSTFAHSYMGVFVDSNAISVDLSGGGNGGNTFECNNSQYGGYYYCSNSNDVPSNYSGADVVNATGSVGVNAQNGAWDNYDTVANQTQVWTCSDTSYSSCDCSGPNCSNYYYGSPTYPPDDADVIYLSTNTAATPVDSTNGSSNSNPNGCQ